MRKPSLHSQFIKHLAVQFRNTNPLNINYLVKVFVEASPGLIDLYSDLLDFNHLVVEFEAGSPYLSGTEGAFERWSNLIDFFDPDALIALSFVQRTGSHDVGTLHKWDLSVLSFDPDLRRLYDKGLSDLHVHMSSMATIPVLWRELMMDIEDQGVHFEQLPRYRPTPLRTDDAKSELKLLHTAKSAWRSGDEPVLKSGGELKELRRLRQFALRDHKQTKIYDEIARKTNSVSEIVKPERLLLASAFEVLKKNDRDGDLDLKKLEQDLDLYLHAKQLFRHAHMQPTQDTNPGLFAFKEFQKAPRPRRPRSILRKNALFLTHRLEGTKARAFLDNANLHRLEMRIKPTDRVRSYYLRFRAFETFLEEIYSKDWCRSFDVRFAVHFSRTLNNKFSDRSDSVTSRFHNLMAQVGQESAVLYLFRQTDFSSVECERAITDWISRIDLAGEERETPMHIFAPFLRLLRGDQGLTNVIGHSWFEPYFRKWVELRDQGVLNARSNSRALGLTCHAGEDYFTPIDGLWSIDCALNLLDCRAGDGLGHCLAAGINAKRHFEQIAEGLRIPSDLQFDSLCWVWHVCRSEGIGTAKEILRLENWLRKEANRLFSQPIELRTIEIMRELIGTPIPVVDFNSAEVGDELNNSEIDKIVQELGLSKRYGVQELRTAYRLWIKRWNDKKSISQCAAYKPIDPINAEFAKHLSKIQNRILKRIVKLGVVIETNPSSNLRVLRVGRLKDLPIIRILKRTKRPPRITVCTDNPGTYDTRIEGEYALLFDALVSSEIGFDREKALSTLRKMRRTGLNDITWPAA